MLPKTATAVHNIYVNKKVRLDEPDLFDSDFIDSLLRQEDYPQYI